MEPLGSRATGLPDPMVKKEAPPDGWRLGSIRRGKPGSELGLWPDRRMREGPWPWSWEVGNTSEEGTVGIGAAGIAAERACLCRCSECCIRVRRKAGITVPLLIAFRTVGGLLEEWRVCLDRRSFSRQHVSVDWDAKTAHRGSDRPLLMGHNRYPGRNGPRRRILDEPKSGQVRGPGVNLLRNCTKVMETGHDIDLRIRVEQRLRSPV